MAKQEESPSRIPVLDYAADNHSAELTLRAFQEGKMVHAYLLTGSRGLGKRTLSLLLAASLLCKEETKPCLHCSACRQVLEGRHPNVLTLFSNREEAIKIDPVRAILEKVSRYSMNSSCRLVLIEPVDRMTESAQNCLLKSLEEPQPGVIYLLMAHESSAALGTIASRCARVKLLPRSDETLHSTLVRSGYDSGAVEKVLRFCDGNIGLAINRLEKNGEDPTDIFLSQTLQAVSDADGLRISAKLKEQKDLALPYLSQLEETLHRVMLVRSQGADIRLVDDLPSLWQKAARSAPMASLNRILSGIHFAQRQSASHVNWQSNLDHLLMIVTEETSKWQKSLA